MGLRLCTICARGGSKGVKDKNIRLFAGKPLIAHSILQAKATGLFEAVAVSSDSDEILSAARAWGADLLVERPAEMATDTAAKCPAIRHCLLETEARLGLTADILVDLAATAPLRLPKDITEAVALLETSPGCINVITGSSARCPPYFSLVERSPDGMIHLSKPLPGGVTRRQDAPACFDMNGSVYVWRREPFVATPAVFYNTTLLFEMPAERSVDIDTEMDFTIAEFLMEQRTRKPS